MPQQREQAADWLILGAGALLFLSLFLAWSHQFSGAFLQRWGSSLALRGVPHDPTGWQVYSAADVLLAALSLALVGVGLLGGRLARLLALAAALVALAFTLHALAVPPTNAATLFDPALGRQSPNSPGSAAGETLALLALLAAIAGLAASLLWPQRSAPGA